jgi:large subunit ribosomal protein L27
MAHKIGTGSTKNTKGSKSKRLGIKCIGTQYVKTGYILVRQRGTKFKAGKNVGCGKDYSFYALCDGIVSYSNKKVLNIIKIF